MTWPAKSSLAKGYGTDPDESAFQAGIISMLTTAQELPGAVPPAALIIASGAITPTTAGVIVDTEGGAAADDLSTINATTMHDGAYLLLRAADASRVITVKHGVGIGAIALDGDADVVLSADAVLVLRRDGTSWREVRMLRAARAKALEGLLPVAQGGTGASSAAGARTTLGLGSASVKEAVATSSGAADGGKVPALDSAGKLPNGFVNFAVALNASGNAPLYVCRAWVNLNGTGAVAIRASGNVSSITDNGTGDYTINFTKPLPSANYCVTGLAARGTGGSGAYVVSEAGGPVYVPAVGSIRIGVRIGSSSALTDVEYVNVAVFN